MPSPIMPVAKSIYLCDEVLHDSSKGKVHLIGAFNAIRVISPAMFPFRPSQICVVVQFVGGSGEMPLRVDIVDTKNGKVVHTVTALRLRFPTRLTTAYACVRLTRLELPAPGNYVVEVYANNIFVEDSSLAVIAEEAAS